MTERIELKSFNVAGVMHRPAEIIDPLGSDEEIRLVFEPSNPYDSNAIRVECKFTYEHEDGQEVKWELIGYVPKKETWLFHVLRKAGIKLYPKLYVNHDASDVDKLLVRVTFDGNSTNEFI